MVNLTRRTFLRASGAAAGVILARSMVAVQGNVLAQTDGVKLGQVIITKKGPVTLHTYVAPEASVSVTTHIIETSKSLIVIDAQFAQTFAGEAAAYAQSLGKPIARHILSHAHPDHWLGANLFTNSPFVTTAAIAAEVQDRLNAGAVQSATGLMGEREVPSEARVPEGSLKAGKETIDGVTFTYEIRQNAEATEHVVVGVPEARTLITQDLLYNNVHFFPGVDRANWITILEDLRGRDDFDSFYVGHGLPTSKGEFDEALAYLNFVQETVAGAASADDIIGKLKARFPSYSGDLLLGFWAQFFKPK